MNTNEQEIAVGELREMLRPGTVVYTVLRRVSASGTSRLLDLYVIEGGEPVRITWGAARALGVPYCRGREAMRVSGCGLDVGHHAVSSLSAVVLGDGNALRHRWL